MTEFVCPETPCCITTPLPPAKVSCLDSPADDCGPPAAVDVPVVFGCAAQVSLTSGENAFGAHPVLEQVASLKEDLKTARQDGERAAQNVKVRTSAATLCS